MKCLTLFFYKTNQR